MVDAGETALAEVAVLGNGGRVLHGAALVTLGEVVVVGLGEAVGQVVQFLWQADGLH